MRLRVLQQWLEAAMIGCHSTTKSLHSELESFIRRPEYMGSDPNYKIKDFIKNDGHYVFEQHVQELLSLKLAETYGRGG
jgi:hypothetical protein